MWKRTVVDSRCLFFFQTIGMATKPDQDWEPVVLKKTFDKKPATATGLSKAIAAGKVDIVKRSMSCFFV